jgi:hypothetical protein
MLDSLNISGISGSVYMFRLYKLPHSFTENRGAVFLFIRYITSKFYVPIFLESTENLYRYFNNNLVWQQMKESGATHICIYLEDDEAKRKFALIDLSNFAD